MIQQCAVCLKPCSSLFFDLGEEAWLCRHCRELEPGTFPYFKETGNNPYNPKATVAHLNDVGDRRWHPKEKRMFHYSKEGLGKTYFFPKGS